MADTSAFGFGKFIPGFDFLQNLAQAGQSASMPPFSHWVAPTMKVEEIDKRIEELKAVQFWLEQNNRALSATIQALQLQKMTLSTLQGMNVNLAEMAKTFPFAASSTDTTPSPKDPELHDWPLKGSKHEASATKPTQPSAGTQQPPHTEDTAAPEMPHGPQAAAALQWWTALTQQFQQIAQQALQDPAQQQAIAQATQMTTDFAKVAVQTASDMVRSAVAKTAAASSPAPAETTTTKPSRLRTTPKAAPAAASNRKPASASAKPAAPSSSRPARKKPAAP